MREPSVEVFVIPDDRLLLNGEREDGSGFLDWGDAYLHVHAGDVLLRATNRHGDVGHAFVCHGRHRAALLDALLEAEGKQAIQTSAEQWWTVRGPSGGLYPCGSKEAAVERAVRDYGDPDLAELIYVVPKEPTDGE